MFNYLYPAFGRLLLHRKKNHVYNFMSIFIFFFSTFSEESLGLDTLKNALKLFESWKILTYRSQNSQKLYSLRQYYNNAFKLKEIIDRIAKYKC